MTNKIYNFDAIVCRCTSTNKQPPSRLALLWEENQAAVPIGESKAEGAVYLPPRADEATFHDVWQETVPTFSIGAWQCVKTLRPAKWSSWRGSSFWPGEGLCLTLHCWSRRRCLGSDDLTTREEPVGGADYDRAGTRAPRQWRLSRTRLDLKCREKGKNSCLEWLAAAMCCSDRLLGLDAWGAALKMLGD